MPLRTPACALSEAQFSGIRMAGTDGRSEKAGGAASDAELARRLDRLSRELDTGKREREAARPPQSKDGAGYAQAYETGERVHRRDSGRCRRSAGGSTGWPGHRRGV